MTHMNSRVAHLARAISATASDGRSRASHCPAHDDNNPSLLVRLSELGDWVNCSCLAGCNFIEVRQAIKGLGLERQVNKQ